MTLFEIFKLFINVNLKDYPNLNVNFEINKFLVAVFFGVIAAIIISNIIRSTHILTVNKLLRHDCIGEDNAKTLGELGINRFRVRYVLSTGSKLKTIIGRSGEKKLSYEEYVSLMKQKKSPEEKINFEEAKFYIKKDKVADATGIGVKSGSIIINTILFCVLAFILLVCLIILMPAILKIINGWLAPKA